MKRSFKENNQLMNNGSLLLNEAIENSEYHYSFDNMKKLPTIETAKLVNYENGNIFISFNECEKPIPALSLAPVSNSDIGKICAIQFINGNIKNPLIIGLIQQKITTKNTKEKEINLNKMNKESNGKLYLKADKEIIIQCGKSSLTMTSDGFIQIRALYIDNYATSTNRIKGGSVQIN
ncbi:hypothetical protein GWJ05_09500 [Proteus sp. G2626]|uniref:DUF6484 domain-containing protein n=1 Tax=Proteus sp. G2626 TaxID=2698842 RepID=UPI0013783486|nr:DUF6484 domain-containing protein [Proteus sp. G2626]NBN46023.1 hypothetical protein [Proteus sp. G2626]